MAQLELSVSKEVPNIKLHRTEASKIMSELFRNALCLNYLEKPSELKFLVTE